MKMISTLALVVAASLFSVGCQNGSKECAGENAACCAGEKVASTSDTAVFSNEKATCSDKVAATGDKACCAGTKAAAAGATANSMCVLNPTEGVSEGVMTDYKGTKVGFCCNGCVGKFNKMSDADKTAKLAKVGVTVK